MNSSEPLQPLTPHEEKLTAYLDGALPLEDAAAFEQENPEIRVLKTQHERIASSVRAHSSSPQLGNGDFFNHQILREISPPRVAASAASSPARRPFPLWRLVLAGACCLLAALGIYQSLPLGPQAPGRSASHAATAPQYLAKVTDVKPGDYLLQAHLVPPSTTDGLAVVWVDGMDRLAKDYVLQ